MRTGGGHWSSSRWAWPLAWVSIIPFFFLISVILLSLFIIRERGLEKKGRAPLLKMSLFSSRGFNVGMLKKDIKTAIAVSTRSALEIGLIFIFIATAIVIFLMPRFKARDG
jgi:hypothetical protein